nr:LamG domain-containing protein [uncultured Undibacterium sp.]
MKPISRVISMFVGVSISTQIMAQTLPLPSLSIDFDPHSLARIGAQYPDGQNFTFVTGREGRPAVEFHGVHRPGVIKVPNSEKLRFIDGASFDMWIKINGDEGMDGWGNASKTSWIMAFIAKSHDRNGFFFGGNQVLDDSFRKANGNFGTYDQTWVGLACETNKEMRAVKHGNWYRLTAVVSSSRGTFIYINQELITSCPNARPSFVASNEQDLFIGRFKEKWYPLDGAIQDLRIYQVALSAEQVKALL